MKTVLVLLLAALPVIASADIIDPNETPAQREARMRARADMMRKWQEQQQQKTSTATTTVATTPSPRKKSAPKKTIVAKTTTVGQPETTQPEPARPEPATPEPVHAAPVQTAAAAPTPDRYTAPLVSVAALGALAVVLLYIRRKRA